MPKSGDRREDGRIWLRGRWCTNEQLEARRKFDKGRCKRRVESGYWKQMYLKRISYERERKRKYYAENKSTINAKRVERAKKNPEKTKAASRKNYHKYRDKRVKAAQEWYSRNRESIREFRKAKYWGNLEESRKIVREGYNRARPTAGLRAALKQFQNGDIGVVELNRRYSEAIEKTDELIRKTLGRKR